jgi:hypothetical protein
MRAGLIGRDHPAGVLRAEIGRAVDSHGGLVLVTGEAGIGKTTLVTDAMEVAREQGALVLSGSCWDSSAAPGLWPWVQVIRALRRQATAGEWAAAEEAASGQLTVLLGESGDPVDGFGMYDAVTSALVAVSQRRPVLVVVDDLHWPIRRRSSCWSSPRSTPGSNGSSWSARTGTSRSRRRGTRSRRSCSPCSARPPPSR